MKVAVKNVAFLGDAVVDMVYSAGFDDRSAGAGYQEDFILINTEKQTYKYSNDSKGRTILDPATNWAAVAALVADNGGTQAITPVAAFVYAAGDQVTMVNRTKTKANLRLQEGFVYTVDRVKANSKGQEIIGFAGLPNDEYLASRATKVVNNGGTAPATFPQNTATSVGVPSVGGSAAVTVSAVDAAGNTLAVGDTVLVTTANPGRRDGKFVLPENGVLTITEITAKGKIGFGGADQYNPARVQKVTVSKLYADNSYIHTPGAGAAGCGTLATGDLVVAALRRDGRFALPENTALTFRGVSVDKGNFILEGFEADTYNPRRFRKVTLVG